MRYLVEFQVEVAGYLNPEKMTAVEWGYAIQGGGVTVVSVENVTREMSQEERGD